MAKLATSAQNWLESLAMRVFVSYPSEHREIADQIHLGLLGCGYEVFFDRDSLPSAGDYNLRIAAAIAKVDLMVFLVSPQSIKSGTYARTELKLARERWPSPVGRVLPVLVEPVSLEEIPSYLKAVTVLQPEGNVVAETVSAATAMVRELQGVMLAAPKGTSSAPQLRVLAKMPRSARLVLVSVAVLLTMFVAVSAVLPSGSGDVAGMIRVASAKDPGFPLDPKLRAEITDTAKRLAALVKRDLLDYKSRSINSWSISQASLALSAQERIAREDFTNYVRSNMYPECACWTEFLDKPQDAWCTFISGWVLMAMADQGVDATAEELRFLLDHQNPQGWWAMFPVNTGASAFASPYATAWALLGLHAQKSVANLTAQQSEQIAAAIDKGVAWLLSVREHDSARWKRYPLSLKSEHSISISGTVMYTLHKLGTPNLRAIDAMWLDSLPEGTVGEAERPYITVETLRGPANDIWEQIQLPWVLAATYDAYPSGNLRQRTLALRWVESTLKDPRVLAADTEPRPWWRAELLFALRHVMK